LPSPDFATPDDHIICRGSNSANALVDLEQAGAFIFSGQGSGYSVSFHDSAAEAESASNPLDVHYEVDQPEKEFYFNVTDAVTGCHSIGSFHVSVIPESTNIDFTYHIETSDWTYNDNSISVIVSGAGDFEYSFDGINYGDDPHFGNLAIGEYQVFIRDKENCGRAVDNAVLMMYPKYFTPNNDGFNDLWNIKFSAREPEMQIAIFDRYGKLLHLMPGASMGWDGRYNDMAMPSSDYWFFVTRNDGKIHKGHFSLKR
jgi:gliding motility-associated-like protein